ncbi:MAG: hypothetical protein EBW87_01590 [Burkholderiaceae bacterium]|nr:hypothetical protein [Burkholderiaceae bacterium]
MSNVTLFSSSNVPAFARNNELSDTAKALTGGGSGVSTKRISIKGGVFRLVAGGKEVASIDDRHLDVVIVRAAPKVSRIFYAGSYDADKIVRPDCWSNDGEKPDPSIKDPQHRTCMGCPQNEAGSGMGNSRACRFQQRLAVVLANNMDGDVLQLTLPATSVFGKEDGDKRPLQAFARFLAAQNPPVNPEQIVTRMKFDTKAESPKLFFAPVRWLTDDEYPTVVSQGDSEDAKKAIVMTVAQADGVKAAPALAIPGKSPVAKAPVVEDEEEAPAPKAAKAPKTKPAADEDDEPEVRKEAPKATAVPAKKSKLADIVSDWDDE